MNEEIINQDYKRKLHYPNINQSWVLVGIFFAVSIGLSIIMLIPTAIGIFFLEFNTTILANWLTVVVFTASFIIPLWIVKLMNRDYSFKESIKYKAKVGNYVYLSLLILIPALSIVLEAISSLIPMPDYFVELFANMVKINVPTFIMVVLLAPILEEILCRGVILNGLLKNTTPLKAILYSALIFAVLHMNPWQGVAAFVIGVIMAWLVWKTGSILPSIFIHFVNNGFAFLLSCYYGETTFHDILGDKYLYLLALCLVIAASMGYYLYQKIENESEDRESNIEA